MSTTNYKFEQIPGGTYVCDCGKYKFNVQIDNQSFVLRKRFNIEKCNDECFLLWSMTRRFHCILEKNMTLFDFSELLNAQIQEQLEKMYLPGGDEYKKAQEKIQSL